MAQSDDLYSDLRSPQPEEDLFGDLKAPLRSPLAEILTAARRVPSEIEQTAGQALQFASPEGSSLAQTGQGWQQSAEQRLAKPEYALHPESHGALTNLAASGVGLAGQIVPYAGAAGLAALTSPEWVPPAATAAIATGLGTVAPALMFGAAQGQATREKALETGKSPAEARTAGLITGGIAGLGGALAGRLGGKIAEPFIEKVAPGVATTGADVLQKYTNPQPVASYLGGLAKHGVETAAGFAGMGAGIAGAEQAYGLPGPTPMEAGWQSLRDAAGLLLVGAPFGMYGANRRNKALTGAVDALSSADTPVEHRVAIADQIANQLHQVEPASAANFTEHASRAIMAGEPLKLDESLLAQISPTVAGMSPERVDAARAAMQEEEQRAAQTPQATQNVPPVEQQPTVSYTEPVQPHTAPPETGNPLIDAANQPLRTLTGLRAIMDAQQQARQAQRDQEAATAESPPRRSVADIVNEGRQAAQERQHRFDALLFGDDTPVNEGRQAAQERQLTADQDQQQTLSIVNQAVSRQYDTLMAKRREVLDAKSKTQQTPADTAFIELYDTGQYQPPTTQTPAMAAPLAERRAAVQTERTGEQHVVVPSPTVVGKFEAVPVSAVQVTPQGPTSRAERTTADRGLLPSPPEPSNGQESQKAKAAPLLKQQVPDYLQQTRAPVPIPGGRVEVPNAPTVPGHQAVAPEVGQVPEGGSVGSSRNLRVEGKVPEGAKPASRLDEVTSPANEPVHQATHTDAGKTELVTSYENKAEQQRKEYQEQRVKEEKAGDYQKKIKKFFGLSGEKSQEKEIKDKLDGAVDSGETYGWMVKVWKGAKNPEVLTKQARLLAKKQSDSTVLVRRYDKEGITKYNALLRLPNDDSGLGYEHTFMWNVPDIERLDVFLTKHPETDSAPVTPEKELETPKVEITPSQLGSMGATAREELINKILDAARNPLPKAVPTVQLMGTDGVWRSPHNFPLNVESTGEKRTVGYHFVDKNGLGMGIAAKSEQELIDRHNANEDRRSNQYREALGKESDTNLQSTANYWLKERSQQEVKTPTSGKPKQQTTEAKKTTPNLGTGNPETDAKLDRLRQRKDSGRGMTAADENALTLYEGYAKSDPSQWKSGDGVGRRVYSGGKVSQISRGFRIVDVNPEAKLALIRQVADTGLTSTGGDNDRFKSEWVHIGDLVKDHKYDGPKQQVAKPVQATKEPWQMSAAEWEKQFKVEHGVGPFPGAHENIVQEAADRGDPIPASVLKEYPTIQNQQRLKSAKERDAVKPTDSLLTAIAKLGGVNTLEARKQGIDPEDLNKRGHLINRVFTKKGKSFDDMVTTLEQWGYPVSDERGPTSNKLLEQIDNELRGTKVYTAAGYEEQAQKEWTAREELEASRDDGTILSDPAVLEGETNLTSRILETAAAISHSEPGVGESILRDAAERKLPDDEVLSLLEKHLDDYYEQRQSAAGKDANAEAAGAAKAKQEGSAGAGPEEPPKLELRMQSEEELAALAEKQAQSQKGKARAEKQADEKAAADRERGDFELQPEGVSNPAVATKMGDLFDKQAETPIKPSVGEGSTDTGIHVIQVQDALRKEFGKEQADKLLAQPWLHVVDNADEIPTDSIRSDTDLSRIQGATTPDGNVYLVSGNLTADAVAGVLLHEGVHRAVQDVSKQSVYRQIMQQLEQMERQGVPWVKEAAARIPEGSPHRAEELLAYAVENHPDLSLVQRFITAIRQVLRKMGIVRQWDQADLTVLARDALLAQGGRETSSSVRHSFSGDAAQSFNAFKKWFRDSKVVDQYGDPLVVYHGTNDNFYEFSKDKARDGDMGRRLTPFYFAEDKFEAQGFGGPNKEPGEFLLRIQHPLDISNIDWNQEMTPREWEAELDNYGLSGIRIDPTVAESGIQVPRELRQKGTITLWELLRKENSGGNNIYEQLEKQGYDGIHSNEMGGTWIAFHPTQIKSTENVGSFDSSTPDVRYSRYQPTGDATLDEVDRKLGLVDKTTWEKDVAPRARRFGISQQAIDNLHTVLTGTTQQRGEALSWFKNRAIEGTMEWSRFIGLREQEKGINIEDPEHSARAFTWLMSESPVILGRILSDGSAQWKDGIIVQKGTEGLFTILKDVAQTPADLQAFIRYRGALRAQRLLSEGREHNLTAVEIQHVLGQIAADPSLQSLYRSVDKRYNQFIDDHLDLAKDAGLVDAATARVWKNYADYIPFNRETEEGVQGPGTRRGPAGQTGFKRLTGGEAPTNDLLSNLVLNIYSTLDKSMKNHMADLFRQNRPDLFEKIGPTFKPALVPKAEIKKFLTTNPEMGAWMQGLGIDPTQLNPQDFLGFQKLWSLQAPTDPDVVRIMEDGKAVYYRMKDPDIMRAMVRDPPPNLGAIMKVMNMASRGLVHAVTAMPDYQVRNLIRDVADGYVLVPGLKVSQLASGVKEAFTSDSRQVMDLAYAGGIFEGRGIVNADDPGRMEKVIQEGLRKAGIDPGTDHGKLFDWTRSAWQWYRQVGVAAENVARVGAAQATLAAGGTPAQAAFAAKDIMPFSMYGNFHSMRVITSLSPFVGARVQGLYRMGRKASLPWQAGFYDRNTLLSGIAWRGMSLSLAAATLWYLNKDDERYKDLPDWSKDMYFHVLLPPGSMPSPDLEHIKIPRPFEQGLVFGTLLGDRLAALFFGDDTPGKYAESVKRGLEDTLALNPIPQAVRPLVEAASNRTFFGPIESFSDEGKLPEARYDEQTSHILRVIGQGVSNSTGLSPKKMEALVRGYTSSLGVLTLGAADALTDLAMGAPAKPAGKITDLPLIGALFSPEVMRSTQSKTDLYDMRQAVREIHNTINSYQTQGKQEAAQQLFNENRGKLQYRNELEEAGKRLTLIRNNMDVIRRNTQLSPANKRAQIDRLQTIENELTRSVVKRTRPAFD